MKKRIQAVIAIIMILCMGLSGCGAAQTAQTAVGTPNEGSSTAADAATEDDNGVVQLTVWAEEANWDVLNQMIESFKQEYAGEAEFEITLVQNADAETKNALLGDIYNGADIFPIADDQMSSLVKSTEHLRKRVHQFSTIISRRYKQNKYLLSYSMPPALP